MKFFAEKLQNRAAGEGKLAPKRPTKKPNRFKTVGHLYKTHLENRSSTSLILCDTTKKKPVTFFMSQAFGAPEGTRTPDLLIRSQTLYPAELPAHILLAFSPENVFYYSAHRPESQAFFLKNFKKFRKWASFTKICSPRGGFSALCRCLKTNIELTNTLQHFII